MINIDKYKHEHDFVINPATFVRFCRKCVGVEQIITAQEYVEYKKWLNTGGGEDPREAYDRAMRGVK